MYGYVLPYDYSGTRFDNNMWICTKKKEIMERISGT